jgi:uncharacterized RDD family membrane protein YckC
MTKYVKPQRDVDLQGHYAGMVSRFVAYIVDAFLIGTIFAISTGLLVGALSVVTGRTWDPTEHRLLLTIGMMIWAFCYFTLSLAAGGRTPGMGLLGLLVVRSAGTDLDLGHAALRTLVFPLSFLLFGIGFLIGVVRRDRRCLHDLIGDTAVVYGWDARGARMRFLASRAEPHLA